ncbi:hypothetical protein ASAP_2777 [Asaia bogorensis]|uniref:Uncharacterized protein n=1 Tax=Asaia bogorensis TaxID=91915 RepID=A0A060QM09_9PROT|nr:hypothetical protein ASAP_2777 [Asaia bogorensis]
MPGAEGHLILVDQTGGTIHASPGLSHQSSTMGVFLTRTGRI